MEPRFISLADKIDQMKVIGELILKDYQGIPAIERNMKRILASLRILELNICDPVRLEKQ